MEESEAVLVEELVGQGLGEACCGHVRICCVFQGLGYSFWLMCKMY